MARDADLRAGEIVVDCDDAELARRCPAAVAIVVVEAAGKWSAQGFLGPGGLIPDFNLALELLLVAGLTFGGGLAIYYLWFMR